MTRFALTVAAAAASLGLAATFAQADSVGLDIYNTTGTDGMDLSGVNLAVEVTDSGSTYDFHFTNGSSLLSSITQLYFDTTLAAVLAGGPIMTPSAGVDFREGTLTKNPPLADAIGWAGSFAYLRTIGTGPETESQRIDNGILNGGVESLKVSFNKVGGTFLTDVLNLLHTSGGIVAHLVNLYGEGLTANVDLTTQILDQPDDDDDLNTIPTPASAAAGLALMALLANRRRD